jgi:hypothetical protein
MNEAPSACHGTAAIRPLQPVTGAEKHHEPTSSMGCYPKTYARDSKGPWLFSRIDLDGPAARATASRTRSNPGYPAISDPAQQNLFSSVT